MKAKFHFFYQASGGAKVHEDTNIYIKYYTLKTVKFTTYSQTVLNLNWLRN